MIKRCDGNGYVGEFELHGESARCPGCPNCWSGEDFRILHHAASTTIQLYDSVERESGVPSHAPLYGKRDRLVELARRLDHEANHVGAAPDGGEGRKAELERCPCGCDTPMGHPEYAQRHGEAAGGQDG